uniref:Uncharacterized protein n=1 Tax=Mycena chlorophos TaxID=658473 RepID=A0ABQ0L6Z7_MYCCL|nr:predicted protein [Mycena chlorophos]
MDRTSQFYSEIHEVSQFGCRRVCDAFQSCNPEVHQFHPSPWPSCTTKVSPQGITLNADSGTDTMKTTLKVGVRSTSSSAFPTHSVTKFRRLNLHSHFPEHFFIMETGSVDCLWFGW